MAREKNSKGRDNRHDSGLNFEDQLSAADLNAWPARASKEEQDGFEVNRSVQQAFTGKLV